MAGNSSRRGATRKAGSKKGATVGTGGHGRRSLEGRGPTPKAEDRPYHVAHKRKVAATKGTTSSGRPTAGASRSAGGARGGRTSSTHEMVAGRNSVLEALRAGIPVTTVYIATRLEADDRTREIVAIAADARYPLLEVGRAELDRLTDDAVHQGVALQVPPYEYAEPDDLLDAAEVAGVPPLVVALDGVTDPRNLGAVLRSAGAFGAHGVLVPERRSAGVTAAAWKVSAGAAARVPVARATNLTRALQAYRQAGVFVVGLDAGGDVPLAELPYANDPLVLVVGSEGKGLSRLVREQCDAIASIPIASAVESLNAGVAAGIALYEVARQRTA
ncbi:23S rRNA (guanosine(2251)-2'-O)-methyltransferase RlmB [Cellulomonas shaoxiangyii]|uniref:23S rRNA (Guanosine(2251)-2'-O)-methyltransferase RlmB n=1 Tax=Cellulomonas shaoxiangyii TaxID=2566013 RepID=A0A4P7SJX8_9CELL|nr:23S rRNA (guanosine(2251)-2'-O)-methyltransferase RlmB [Cellulomonas shaoxiangyii]QCB94589.1 23S rRNA (guanosine(2251)-2'-O)-methyltransferase RlmB [Cellulomonas shaoxiangyii]TGY85005.1 23S rRNA (guanosine(2251)-2'-O)-methyltransferase RlmB [Cellulomonas shaoxiangyii]